MTPEPSPPAGAPSSPTGEGSPQRGMVRLPTHPVRLTYVFLVLIGLVFLAQLASEQFLGSDVVIFYGAKINEFIAQGEVWRLLTAVFIHVNLLHVGFNAYALFNIGSEVERFYGSLRFGLLFLLTGIAGSVLSLLFNPSPAVGASGAVFGLIGAEGVFLYRHRQMFGERGRRSLQNIVVIAVINLVLGLQGGIDNWGHVGGLLGGLALGWMIGPVWAVQHTLEPALVPAPAAVTLADQHPLTGLRWLGVLGFGMALTALIGLALILQR